ncbi:MAG TPA: hypothetical protein VGO11_17075, partial [Chthoniobacteraceae bacterium]|nr:hypothetical protein [Chthoniobacteraceae bacterium]
MQVLHRSAVVHAVILGLLLALPERAQAVQSPDDWGEGTPFAYIVWDGHRFSQTPEEHERDVRYFRDLGFTHSLVDARPGAIEPKQLESRRALLAAFQKYDLIAGLRYGWRFDGLQRPWEEMTAQGMTLRATAAGKADPTPVVNPLHREVIDSYASSVLESFAAYRALDPGRKIGLFLIGSEYTFALPEREKIPPPALAIILQAAREDGVLAAGEEDWTKVKQWWNSPTGHGRDWRIREAIAAGVHKEAPGAKFMIDPIWCVKLVEGGFGGHWSYIGKGMVLGMPDSAIRIMAQCWPSPATHSTQLIRGAHQDTIQESNFLSMCVGLPSLYHWGVHTIEPGMGENPYYGFKGIRSPEMEASLRAEYAAARLDKEPALRATGRFIRERGQLLHDWKPMEPRVAYLAGIYGPADPHLAMLVGQIPFDLLQNRQQRDSELAKYKFAMVGSSSKGPLDVRDYESLLKIEAAGGAVLVPKGFTPPEGAKPLARALEWDPEIVGTGIGSSKGINFAAGYTALQEHTKAGAAHLRGVLARAGFQPYFDLDSVEVVSRPYTYKGQAMLFVVNDKRTAGAAFKEESETAEPDATGAVKPKPKQKPEAGPPPALVGVPADVEVFVRDTTAGLKVIDIDTGAEMKLAAAPGGQKFKDTIPGAWYR